MAFNNRGSLRMKRMEYRNAISDFKTAIDLNDNIELYKENYSKARRFYRLDSVLFADYFTSMFSTEDKIEYIKIAFDRLIAQGKARLALEYLLIGLKLNNDDISMLQNVATIYSNLKQYDLSIRYYKHLISLNPRKAEYYYFLANNYFNKGNISEACENWSVAKLYGHAQAAKYFDIYCK
jgi:tetratricopeptide (TPR) repeat protein